MTILEFCLLQRVNCMKWKLIVSHWILQTWPCHFLVKPLLYLYINLNIRPVEWWALSGANLYHGAICFLSETHCQQIWKLPGKLVFEPFNMRDVFLLIQSLYQTIAKCWQRKGSISYSVIITTSWTFEDNHGHKLSPVAATVMLTKLFWPPFHLIYLWPVWIYWEIPSFFCGSYYNNYAW